MPLGMEVGLGPGDTVLDGKHIPLKRDTAPAPQFAVCLLWPNGRPSQLLPSTCYKKIFKKNAVYLKDTVLKTTYCKAVMPFAPFGSRH